MPSLSRQSAISEKAHVIDLSFFLLSNTVLQLILLFRDSGAVRSKLMTSLELVYASAIMRYRCATNRSNVRLSAATGAVYCGVSIVDGVISSRVGIWVY